MIIIDPRYTDSVVTEHAEWLPIRPTTDAALVAAIAHTLIKENLIDEERVNTYCVGYDRSTLPETAKPNASYKDYVLGNGDDGVEKHLNGRQISVASRLFVFASWHVKWPKLGPVSLPRMGPQRHANGEQTSRAVQILPALTGHFGLPRNQQWELDIRNTLWCSCSADW